jgi:hypothetical protein
VQTNDNAGNATTTTLTPIVDASGPPSYNFSSPTSANIKNGQTLSVAPTDAGSGVASVSFYYCPGATCTVAAGTLIGTTSTGPTYSVTWASQPADGQYTLIARATDNVGNYTDANPITVKVDNTAPVTTIDDPGANVRGTLQLTGTATDGGSGVDSVEFQISPAGAGQWQTIGTDPNGTDGWSASLDTTQFADGLYDLRTVATDVVGNVGMGAPLQNMRIDNTPPTVLMHDPGTNLRGTVSIAANAADTGSGVATVDFQVEVAGSGNWQTLGTVNPSGGISYQLDTTQLDDGLYDFRAYATDLAGNGAGSNVTANVRLDNTAPTTTSDAPSTVQSSDVTVNLSATDAGSGVDHTEWRVDGGATQTGATATIAAPGDHSDDGTHTLEFRSVDLAGNVESWHSASIVIDTTPPSGSGTSPGAVVRGTVPLSVTLQPDPNPVPQGVTPPAPPTVQFELSSDGGTHWSPLGPVVAQPPYSVNWDTTSVADGSYRIAAVATDAVGNVSTPITVGGTTVVDNTAPTGSVLSPNAGSTVSGSVTLAASATDATSGVASVSFAVNGNVVGTDTSWPYQVNQWDTTPLADGSYDLVVTITDVAGNSTTLPTRTFSINNHQPAPPPASTVNTGSTINKVLHSDGPPAPPPDTTPPILLGATPADGTVVAAASTIVLHANEPLGPLSNVLVDGAAASESVQGSTVTLAAGPLGPGPHVISGTIADTAGNLTAVLVHFTVWPQGDSDRPYVEKNTNPNGPTTFSGVAGTATASVPPGAVGSVPADDWAVTRLGTGPTPRQGFTGHLPSGAAVTLTAALAKAGTRVLSFGTPVELSLPAAGSGSVPGESDDGVTWRAVPVAVNGALAADQSDGYYRSGDGQVHILTRHPGWFAMFVSLSTGKPKVKPKKVSHHPAGKLLHLKRRHAKPVKRRLETRPQLADGKRRPALRHGTRRRR